MVLKAREVQFDELVSGGFPYPWFPKKNFAFGVGRKTARKKEYGFMQDHHYSCLALATVSFPSHEARVTSGWQRATGVLVSTQLRWSSVLRPLHAGTTASRGCCLLTEPAVLLARLSGSCWAWALGLCESLGMFIWFPSLVPTP